MPRRKIIFKRDYFYHIYNRALNKEIIFLNNRDFIKFIFLIKIYLKKNKGIKIYAYAIIPNHFHFLISSKKSGKEISKFMGQLQRAYSMYFKLKYKENFKAKTGVTLFQGRFKSKLVKDEKYINKLVEYIKFNPIKHKLVEKIEDYIYTSNLDKFKIISKYE